MKQEKDFSSKEELEMKPLNNVKLIKVKDGVVTITYQDGTKFTTKDDITLGLDYKNENDYPLVDHCIQRQYEQTSKF